MEFLPVSAVLQKASKPAIVVASVLILLTVTPALYSLLGGYSIFPFVITSNPFLLSLPPPSDGSSSSSSPDASHDPSPSQGPSDNSSSSVDEEKCDYFSGEWVSNPEAPYYTNTTCWAIHEHQNCIKYGRPDTEFMKWRWKPDGCELPVFNPIEFLQIVSGKAMAFVGDSISRNQVQSLLCLLSRVEYPQDISPTADTDFRTWKYPSYNFTVHALWSPFLVSSTEADPSGPDKTGLFNLYIDEFDPIWMAEIGQLDYLIISSGHWFFRPVIFYENRQLVGCHYCGLANVTVLPLDYGYRKALRTVLKAILDNFAGVAFFRTFSPHHFEGGPWNKGGDCIRTRPYRRNETVFRDENLEFHNIQLEEFRAAEEEAVKKGLRLRLIDTTQAMLLRPDGHPGKYGHPPNAQVTLFKDCVHWCLPGPIDTWNDFLLRMMKTEK
ncbi:PREDICTED: protein trichome birefringence-like 21 [Tarenaya hassleriana]|uniref:Uncharacterized protein n=1 Tax=Tarenaya spinosa TaxID=228870 RepID=Q1KUX1_9ROSI|nr:PREDICTED: protein trichome birefringence-like 21 [Tarenaya hassleriana]ABD96865.1 hypothetical protein [Tarenaya spinosa]